MLPPAEGQNLIPMSPSEITARMLENDAFSAWLGVEVLHIELGKCTIRFTVNDTMCNGFGTAHGGIAHAAADSAFAFACNSYGDKAVAAETSMSYLRPLFPGDVVEISVVEQHRSRRLGRYRADITRDGEAVALFNATCYILDERWDE